MKAIPSLEVITLNRIAYGHSPADLAKIRRMGVQNYMEEQLNPVDTQDVILNQKLQESTLLIEYQMNNKGKMMGKVKENRPLTYLNASLNSLWNLTKESESNPIHHEEKIRPLAEVIMSTWLKAVYSSWQLREILTEFWHNHFNINAIANEKIASVFPIYDREVIRKNCLGNFRTFLEDVAKSPAMLYYLDNAFSKASPANENYARELFELHTLGADNYLNHLYNRWREVPGALEGKPIGYIDEDVYEAARAFTGWTVADGSYNEKGAKFPNTGEFLYFDGWHDNYQKRVLGVEFPPNQAPLADGMKVLDLVAFHPATAKHLCTKLCRRLLADEPPLNLIEKVVKVWIEKQKSPDQIKEVVKTIVLSTEFQNTFGQKIKRPFELIASYIRATQLGFQPNRNLYYLNYMLGYRHFSWASPTGHPDKAAYWLNTNMMLGRWNMMMVLLFPEWHQATSVNLLAQTPKELKSYQQIAEYWLERILARPLVDNFKNRVIAAFAEGGNEEEEWQGTQQDKENRLKGLVAMIAMSPEFQYK